MNNKKFLPNRGDVLTLSSDFFDNLRNPYLYCNLSSDSFYLLHDRKVTIIRSYYRYDNSSGDPVIVMIVFRKGQKMYCQSTDLDGWINGEFPLFKESKTRIVKVVKILIDSKRHAEWRLI